ncbi:MAG: superoxide dismutase [Bacteroidales bacterium]|jgi:Fe-Mn family superoxide dismutase|nr:superoxide dismutase [Bacteroidales bacterium]
MNAITLPYASSALNPAISEQTINFHFGKHYQTYVSNLNKLIAGTPFEKESLIDIVKNSEGVIFNNAAQVWNHEFYFEQFTPPFSPSPARKLIKSIENQWNSFGNFKKEFSEAAISLFGAGWTWLARENDNNKLYILKETNAETPFSKGLTPVLTFDVWEHAYYLDYQNRRADYISALWNIINWDIVEQRFVRKKNKNQDQDQDQDLD